MGATRSELDTAGLFDHFYTPMLAMFRERLHTELRKHAGRASFIAVDEIVDAATDDLLGQLLTVCSRALIYEFHLWRRGVEMDSPDGYTYYERFAKQCGTDAGRESLFRRYPVLRMLVDLTVNRRIDLLVEAVRRYVADRAALIEPGVVTCGDVLRGVRCSSGDLHNGGRKVLVFELDSARVVYKPRPMHTDRLFQAVLAEVNRDLSSDEAVRLPLSVHRRDYGWQAFVDTVDNEQPADVRRYFRRVGVFLGVFTALGSGDLHHENVIAARDEPLFIDLETVVGRKQADHVPTTLHEAFFERLSTTVLGTMLLPARVVGSVFDFDISGLGSTASQVSERWQNHALTGAGTDEIRLEKRKVELTHSSNLCTLNGSPVDPVAYGDDIRAGLRAAMESLRARRDAIREIMFADVFTTMPVRQVLRPTAVYGKFLEAATHPHYLTSTQARHDLIAKVGRNPKLPDDTSQWVLDKEIEALIDGDIPYFTADFGGRNLIANTRTILPEAYPDALREQVYDQFQRNVDKPITENEYLVGAALLTSVTDAWRAETDTRSHCLAELFEPTDAATVCRRIGDFFHDTAIWQYDRARCSWLTPLLTGTEEVTLDLANFTLYEGGGSLLFLAELAAATGDRRYAELAMAGVPEPERWPAIDPLSPDVSAFSGAGSTIYLLSRLAELLGSPSLAEARDEQLEQLERLDLTLASTPDYVGGLAGLVVVLANLTTQWPPTSAELVLTKCAPVLAALVNRRDGKHLAHGELGVALALGRAGAALGDVTLLDQARDILRRLLDSGELFSGAQNWCWGAAGAVQASARLMIDIEMSLDEVNFLLAGPIDTLLSLPPGGSGDLSLCHGWAGHARALTDACRLLGDHTGAKRAHDQLLATLRTVPANGYRGGLAHSAGLPTFMLGLSGVGHALLAPTGSPSALLLELEEPTW